MDDAEDCPELSGGCTLLPGLYGVEGCLEGGAQTNTELEQEERDDGAYEHGLGGAWLVVYTAPIGRAWLAADALTIGCLTHPEAPCTLPLSSPEVVVLARWHHTLFVDPGAAECTGLAGARCCRRPVSPLG